VEVEKTVVKAEKNYKIGYGTVFYPASFVVSGNIYVYLLNLITIFQ